MAIEVFNRFEAKFLIDAKIRDLLIEDLLLHMTPDIYNGEDVYQIANIYYDTIDDELISTSIEKPVYKEKLRLRGYGIPDLDSMVYLEIKKKYNGLVNKRRSKMKLSEAYEFLRTKKMPELQPYMNPQVMKELHFFLNHHELYPKLYLGYERVAFFGKEKKDLRISFDNRVITRRDDLFLESGCHGLALLDDEIIMEIKVSDAMPLWLVQLLGKYQIVQTSFSKYGTEYSRNIVEKKGITLYV